MPDFLCLFSDQIVFWVAQVGLVFLAVYSRVRDYRGQQNKGVRIEITRGADGWNDFNLVYGVLALILLEMISTTEAAKGFKTAVTFFDLSVLLYLCFFNAWFRNKVAGIVLSSRNKVETFN